MMWWLVAALVAMLVFCVVAGYFEWCAYMRRLDAANRWVTRLQHDVRRITDAHNLQLNLRRHAESLLEWERIQHAATQAERDRYATALQAKFELEMRRDNVVPLRGAK